eukprot:scaffold676_cov316-Pavlova_lutheri.AAC.62
MGSKLLFVLDHVQSEGAPCHRDQLPRDELASKWHALHNRCICGSEIDNCVLSLQCIQGAVTLLDTQSTCRAMLFLSKLSGTCGEDLDSHYPKHAEYNPYDSTLCTIEGHIYQSPYFVEESFEIRNDTVAFAHLMIDRFDTCASRPQWQCQALFPAVIGFGAANFARNSNDLDIAPAGIMPQEKFCTISLHRLRAKLDRLWKQCLNAQCPDKCEDPRFSESRTTKANASLPSYSCIALALERDHGKACGG